MIDPFLLLATESHAEGEALIGFHFDFLESNILNLAILIGVLVFYGRKVVGNILSERRNQIAEAIQEAEGKQRKAAEALAKEKENLAQAQKEAERIQQAATERAKTLRTEIEEQSKRDIARLKETAAADLSSEQERVMAQLKKQIAEQAIAQAESQLKAQVDNNTQQRLIDRSITRLGG